MTEMTEEWAQFLRHRSAKDKIGVARELCPVGDLAIISELVREGVMVWIDRAVLGHLALGTSDGRILERGIDTDIYQLTLRGIRLCDQHGIKRQ